jgi:hypothetical protein
MKKIIKNKTKYHTVHAVLVKGLIKQFLLLHHAFWNLKLVIYQQMHYLLHLERFNFTQ